MRSSGSRITCNGLGHVSQIGCVLHRCCTTSHNGRLGSISSEAVDRDLDRDLFDVCKRSLHRSRTTSHNGSLGSTSSAAVDRDLIDVCKRSSSKPQQTAGKNLPMVQLYPWHASLVLGTRPRSKGVTNSRRSRKPGPTRTIQP